MGSVRETLCRNLNLAYKQSGFSQKQLAEHLQVSQAAVTNWMKGNNAPDIETLVRLCNLLNAPLVSLLGLEERSYSQEDDQMMQKLSRLDQKGKDFVASVIEHELSRIQPAFSEPEADNIIQIPFYNLPVSAGTGIYLDDTYKEEISAERSPLTERAGFALRISGNSMEPRYHNGDILLVQEQQTLSVGECGIFILNGEGYFKKLGEHALISLNSDYAPIQIHPYDRLECIGKVIGKLS